MIAAKRVSEDTELDLKFDLVLGNKSIAITEVKLSDFVACFYDGKCWIGLVFETNREHQDLKVNFMHPSFPARSFFWPAREDICFVPYGNIVCNVDPPSTSTGRQYIIEKRQPANCQ